MTGIKASRQRAEGRHDQLALAPYETAPGHHPPTNMLAELGMKMARNLGKPAALLRLVPQQYAVQLPVQPPIARPSARSAPCRGCQLSRPILYDRSAPEAAGRRCRPTGARLHRHESYPPDKRRSRHHTARPESPIREALQRCHKAAASDPWSQRRWLFQGAGQRPATRVARASKAPRHPRSRNYVRQS